MASEESLADLQRRLVQLRVTAAKQNEDARSLRQQHAPAADIEAASIQLGKTRQEIVELEHKLLKHQGQNVPSFIKYKQQCENLLKRKFFVVPAFEIYGGVGGLYDFGPPGCALKGAVESLWRAHFVLEEDMLEISGPCLTPHIVLKTSGHVDRFTDLMVKDEVTQECLRADKYLEEIIEGKVAEVKAKYSQDGILRLPDDAAKEVAELELIGRQADSYSAEEMQELFNRFKVVSPKGNALTPPFPFNLMFGLKIGPKDESSASPSCDKQQQEGRGYLRPETAQGIFVNFRRLYEFVGGRMPFAAAQLGLGFRNEIAPRNGLLRVREFQMAEIEHFCHPEKKDEFPKFELVKNEKLPLFSRERQLGDGIVERDMTLQEAVDGKVIANRTLAYFLARTFAFLTKVGISKDHIRFRQHLKTEMAHYAADCWDAEVETSYGWIEVAGHADRAAFDLTNHTRVSKVDLVAMEKFDPPRRFTFMKPVYNKQLLGSTFKQKQAAIVAAVEDMNDAERESLEAALEAKGAYQLSLCDGCSYAITREMLRFEKTQKTVGERPFVPAVIEPSFGIGRILHCIMEHAFRSREMAGQEERVYMKFPPLIAPTKVVLLPLSSNAVFEPVLQQLRSLCVQGGLTARTDASSASIGKRYARNDELGTPFAITVDFESPKDGSVTLRERDSMQQVRLSITEAVHEVKEMCEGRMSWTDVTNRHQVIFVNEE